MATSIDRESLTQQIKEMRPWHHDVEIADGFSTGKVFSENGRLQRPDNDGVSLISPKVRFMNQIDSIFPEGLSGKRFLDCACNGGGYCFWAREKGASNVYGFDVREHWINQAKFIQQHRTAAPVDNIEFEVMDLYDLPKKNLDPFDMTYFSGIFYHLPDPITGLKIAADLTKDTMLLSTAAKADPSNPTGLTMARESTTKVMSGVYQMAWFPNGPECLKELLLWCGFKDIKLTMNAQKPNLRLRLEVLASKEKGRLDGLEGESLV